MLKICSGICAVIFAGLLVGVNAIEPKGVSVSLRAKWPGTSTLLEAMEFLAADSPNAFWSFVEAWQQPDEQGEGCWDDVTSKAGQYMSSCMALSLQQALASRQYTAKVEMLRNLAELSEDACCWTEFAGQHFSGAGQLAAALKKGTKFSSAPQLYPFDHIYPSASAANFKAWQAGNASAAVLYGTPGTTCFREIHQMLKDAVKSQHIAGGMPLAYAVRPALLQGCSELDACSLMGTRESLHLAGYGVEMAIKNMEYSALDDSQVAAAKQAQQEAGRLEGGPEEVQGFLLGRLLERRPELEQELLTFRDHLLAASSSSEDQTLKVWDLKDLGLQASQRIAQASDPLRLLTDISQNFPTLAASLSRLPVNASLAAEVKSNQQSLPAGVNVMMLNGLPVDVSNLELYSLLERISAETRLTDMLKATELQPEDIQGLLRLRATASALDSSNLRIDLAPYHYVHWVNNLEKDRKRYRGFTRHVMDLLVPSFPGNLPSIARNLFNAVFVVDLGSLQGIGVAEAVVRAIGSKWPVRMGLLPFVPEALQAEKKTGSTSTSKQVASISARAAQALHTLDSSFGASACLYFLSQLQPSDPYASSSSSSEPSMLTLPQLEGAFKSAWDMAASEMTNPSASPEELELTEIEPADAWQQLQDSSGVASGSNQAVLEGTRFALSRGLISSEGEGSLWMNGLVYGGVLAGPQQALMRGIFSEMRTLQEHVYYKAIQDSTPDILAELLQLEGALQRYNPRLIEQPSSTERPDVRQQTLLADGLMPTKGWLAKLGYLYPPGAEDSLTAITHWVCIDPDKQAGQGLLLAALEHIQMAPAADAAASRIGVLYNPTDKGKEPSLLAKLLLVVLELTSRRAKIAGFVTSLLSDRAQLGQLTTSYNSALELAQEAGLNLAAIGRSLEASEVSKLTAQLRAQTELTQGLLGLPAGSSAVVTNGRVVVVHSPALGLNDDLCKEDFELLDLYANSQQMASGIHSMLEDALSQGRAVAKRPDTSSPDIPNASQNEQQEEEDLTTARLSNAALLASSILAAHGNAEASERSQGLGQVVSALGDSHCAITGHAGAGPSASPPAYLKVEVVVNPLSKAAQRLSPILEWLHSSFQASIKVFLNPERELSDMPIKSFYRYVLPKTSSAGSIPQSPAATFNNLPPRQILTLNFDAPEMWLVEPVIAEHDLDNLKLEQLGDSATLSAEYELEALMLTGRCVDRFSRRRDLVNPRGVQLHLGNQKQPHLQDTLVMSNLGYFQLKSAPGAWTLQLAPGRSKELYRIQSSTGTVDDQADSVAEAGRPGRDYETAVAIGSLQGKDMLLEITKRPGFEQDDVLDAPEEHLNSVWGIVSSWVSKPKPLSEPALGAGVQSSSGHKMSPEDDQDTIHIFSVASGHMYERLQKIMILSVIRNTRNPVKFWFIKNYMSPQMKRFVPEMAAHYKFHFQFVTYKWPAFLHKQTEKQRLIWAYKILFLDVLFPLNLRKVIFCDSDQVVRGDMAELWNMDLKGAPFGFTPFCDNNKDMEGFRFWKQGFWKEHLRGKPYHISALFVVDLARFRQTAAGDQLRVTYEQLSKDPNSLSNLDQDLPNYAQHSVPIYSLPMEWLWCETWCGNATKQYAKTIDLCNNPLTKEPKLQGARRIVSEWPAFDEEARSFTTQVEGRLAAQDSGVKNQEQSEMQDKSNVQEAVDINVLGVEKQQEEDKVSSTLQYLAQQAGISHEFQKYIQAQKQDKSEL